MPVYSDSSQRKLFSCHRDLQSVFLFIIDWYDHTIVSGQRTEQEQQYLYDLGRSTLRGSESKHVRRPVSLAVDAAPWIPGVGIPWPQPDDSREIRYDKLQYFYLFAGLVMGVARLKRVRGEISHRFRWGGDWDGDWDLSDNRFDDLCHFELV